MKPDQECLIASEWYVGDCPLDLARELIRDHHYAAGTSNTATHVHGLYREGRGTSGIGGVTWWIPPVAVGKATWPHRDEVLSLSRMVILPDIPKNAATFLLARSAKLVGPAWKCLVTYADTWRGHTGAIYKAANWEDLGLTTPEAVYVLDGRMLSRKRGNRTRTHAEMIAMGAEFLGRFPKHRFRLVRPAARSKPTRFYKQDQFL
jgi:hypothetical protein